MAATTEYARHVIDEGFIGAQTVYATKKDGMPDFSQPDPTPLCEFRDLPPTGLAFSRIAEAESELDEDGIKMTIGGGAVLADHLGDFILSIEVPDELVRPYLVAWPW